MLILSRKKDESILIGDKIKVTIVDVQKNVIRLGIEAPAEYTILREELIFEVQSENQKAREIHATDLSQLSRFFKEISSKDQK